jgi:hypothetical protein
MLSSLIRRYSEPYPRQLNWLMSEFDRREYHSELAYVGITEQPNRIEIYLHLFTSNNVVISIRSQKLVFFGQIDNILSLMQLASGQLCHNSGYTWGQTHFSSTFQKSTLCSHK